MKVDHTFIILAFENCLFLNECIESLQNQTLVSNVIICTSTPSKNLAKIAQKYKIKLYINDIKTSIVLDWNYAIEKADTELVTLVHQDDIYNSKYLEKIYNKISKNNLIAFTNYFEQNDTLIQTSKFNMIKFFLLIPFLFKNTIKSKFFKRAILQFGNPICCPTVTYNKKKIPNFRFDKSFSNNMDWNAWLELSKLEGSFLYLPSRLLIHRIHNNSATSKNIYNSKAIEDKIMFAKLWYWPFNKIFSGLYSLSYKKYYFD
tara:strand:+ start:1830 stop:2609 length:780 start_codon:yes stop_codon:yes gene_type:complete